MGSAASTLTIPDILDEETCKKLAGEKFDQALFDTSKDEAGNITKEQFTQIWNSKMSTSEGETKATKIEKTGPEPDVTPVDLEVQKKFHSMSRWNKPWAEEMAPFIAQNPGCQNSVDAVNGNLPLHIAAQNGHVDLVGNLLKIGVSMDAPNGTGTTALHVSCLCVMLFVLSTMCFCFSFFFSFKIILTILFFFFFSFFLFSNTSNIYRWQKHTITFGAPD